MVDRHRRQLLLPGTRRRAGGAQWPVSAGAGGLVAQPVRRLGAHTFVPRHATGHRVSRLFLYVARQYAAHLLLVLLALVVLVLGVTLIENAGALARNDSGPAAAWHLCRWSMAEYAYQNWPIAAVVAALSCSATMGRDGETLAIMATGQAPWRLALPYLVVALLGAALMT
ncbi:MAG: LptF/LptG family permease, partial [Deltaproteobacteria bacterium]